MSLECYWKLVSTESKERVQAAHELLTSLKEQPSTSGSGPLSADVDYAIKRLVRGLSSSTEAARQGFAACLAEVLAVLPHVKLSLVKEHMDTSTEVTGSVRGQEERDMLLGRLFTCLAVARSGRLLTEEENDEWTTGSEFLEIAIGIFSKRKVLRSLAAEAVVALIECMPPQLFCESPLVDKLGESLGCNSNNNENGEEEDGKKKQKKKEELGLEELNPDQLAVGLAVQAYLRRHGLLKHASLAGGRLPRWLLTSKRILKAKRVPKLVEPLKASSSAFPQMHPVWERIMKELLEEEEQQQPEKEKNSEEDEEEKDEATLQALWVCVVDGVLACGTHERKALSLFLLQRVCQRVSATTLSFCLSPHVLKVLLSALSTAGTADEVLKPLAKQTLEMLVEAGQGAPEKRLVMASALLTRCDVNFDQKTGTKTVEGLLEGLGTQDLLAFVRHLAQAYEDADAAARSATAASASAVAKAGGAEGAGEEEEAAAAAAMAKKLWAVDALYALSKSPALNLAEGTEVIRQVLRLLLSLAFFSTESYEGGEAGSGSSSKKKKKEKKGSSAEEGGASSWIMIKASEVTPDVRKVAAARLHSLLADLGKRATLRFETAEGGLGSLGWLWAAHEAWRGLEAHGAVLVAPLGDKAREARETMLGLVGEIRERSSSSSSSGSSSKSKKEKDGGGGHDKVASAFAALIMQIGLQQLQLSSNNDTNQQQEEDFLGDLCRCYDDMVVKAKAKEEEASKKRKTRKGKKAEEEEEEKDEEVDAMAVLADICVGALAVAQEGVAVRGLRDIIRKAWGLVCSSSTLSRPALEVLLGVVCKVPAGGEGDEEGSDDEMHEDSSGSSSDDDDEEDQAALATLDKALKSAGVVANGGDSNSEDSEGGGDEEEEEEEEIMLDANDSAAFMRVMGGSADENQDALDHMLALRQANHQGTKQSRLELERLGLQHRLRTLDLLEVTATKQSQSPLLLLTIRPCLKAIKALQTQAGPGRPPELMALSTRLGDFLNKRLPKTRPKLLPVVTGSGDGGGGGGVEAQEIEEVAQGLMGELKKACPKDYNEMLLASLTVCTRAVVNANDGVAPTWLKELYCDGLKDFMTKHGTSAAPFEQLMERFPSVACVVLLEALNTHAVSSSERAFCQAEAFRLIGLLLGKRRNLSPEAKEVLHRGLGPLMTGLAKVLEEQAADLNSKRLKPLVECCQTVTTVLKDDKWLVVQASADTGAAGANKKGKGKNKKKEEKEAPATTTTAAANHREASLALGQVLLTVRAKIASDNVKASCLRIAKQLGVSVPAENGAKKEVASAPEEEGKKKEEEGKKDKKNQKKRPHAGAEEEKEAEEGQRKTGSTAKKGGQTEKAQGQKKSKKAK